MMADGMLDSPLRAVLRKGKSHYVCDARLMKRLQTANLDRKNPLAKAALLSMRDHLDLDMAPHLSGYDRERICVPPTCDCGKTECRYLCYLDVCASERYAIQVCNHNLLLADAIHRGSGKRPILPDSCAIVMDEAHKLPETARQMFGVTLNAQDFAELIRSLHVERYVLAAELLSEAVEPLAEKLSLPVEEGAGFDAYQMFLERPHQVLTVICRQLEGLLTRETWRLLSAVASTVSLFYLGNPEMIFYAADDDHGGAMLCGTVSELAAQLQATLWRQEQPIVLTSGTLMAGGSFKRTKKVMGLSLNQRLEDFIAVSPFNYEENCLLYIPNDLPKTQMGSEQEAKCLAEQICRLVEATHGHTLVLFTSYSLMGAVYNQVKDRLSFPLMEVWRHSQDVIHQFKQASNAVLFAAGSCWEGVDFPGDMVSSLILVRLPFPVPDPLSEAEREQYPTLQDYIKTVVIPDMQVKLRQGFGRAIRTETDTCVVSILDYRAAPGERYHKAVLETLPNLRLTRKIEDVEEFIRAKKGPDYFMP